MANALLGMRRSPGGSILEYGPASMVSPELRKCSRNFVAADDDTSDPDVPPDRSPRLSDLDSDRPRDDGGTIEVSIDRDVSANESLDMLFCRRHDMGSTRASCAACAL